MAKPRVKCIFRGLQNVGHNKFVALVDRLSDHPKLGSPRVESITRTSLVVRYDKDNNTIETLNTVYWWD